MSGQHTPGRLTVHSTLPKVIFTPDGQLCIAKTFNCVPEDEAVANARRLVACWNACDGLSTDQIESMVNMAAFFFKHIELMAERDKLLAAIDVYDKAVDRTGEANENLFEQGLKMHKRIQGLERDCKIGANAMLEAYEEIDRLTAELASIAKAEGAA